MNLKSRDIVKVITGNHRLKGMVARVDDLIDNMPGNETDLERLALSGNFAAINAVTEDHYTQEDGPFYYVKDINTNLGYIIAEEDLEKVNDR